MTEDAVGSVRNTSLEGGGGGGLGGGEGDFIAYCST